jgi:hypothetical protein
MFPDRSQFPTNSNIQGLERSGNMTLEQQIIDINQQQIRLQQRLDILQSVPLQLDRDGDGQTADGGMDAWEIRGWEAMGSSGGQNQETNGHPRQYRFQSRRSNNDSHNRTPTPETYDPSQDMNSSQQDVSNYGFGGYGFRGGGYKHKSKKLGKGKNRQQKKENKKNKKSTAKTIYTGKHIRHKQKLMNLSNQRVNQNNKKKGSKKTK